MMGLDQIKAANMEAAERAASEDRVPFVYYPDDVVSGTSFPFPGMVIPRLPLTLLEREGRLKRGCRRGRIPLEGL